VGFEGRQEFTRFSQKLVLSSCRNIDLVVDTDCKIQRKVGVTLSSQNSLLGSRQHTTNVANTEPVCHKSSTGLLTDTENRDEVVNTFSRCSEGHDSETGQPDRFSRFISIYLGELWIHILKWAWRFLPRFIIISFASIIHTRGQAVA
jgi:hypothetical protein